jgi:hypothetical protein
MDNDLLNKIAALEDRIRRLESVETSNVIFLNQVARVLSDGTARVAPYTNAAVQVTGVAGLPSNIRGIFYSLYVQAGAVLPSIIIENPSYVFGAGTYFGQVINAVGTVGNFVSLNSSGQLQYKLVAGNVANVIIDVWAYVPGKTP